MPETHVIRNKIKLTRIDIVLREFERFLGPHVHIGVLVLRRSNVVLGNHGRDGRAELVPAAG